jgi:hypothetical protein
MELCGTLGVINATSSGPRPQGPIRDGQEAPISRAERPNRRRQEDGDMNGKRAPSTFPGIAAPMASRLRLGPNRYPYRGRPVNPQSSLSESDLPTK